MMAGMPDITRYAVIPTTKATESRPQLRKTPWKTASTGLVFEFIGSRS